MRTQHSDNPKLNTLLNQLASAELPVIELSLDRIHALLKALGNPHKKLPPVIHIAGTNGKGSLVAYLRAIFERAGLKVHQYTSPYLTRFNEQIVVAGKEIKDEQLIDIINRIFPKLNRHPATFFEAVTAAAFVAFADTKADIVLLETGMGGRLDATNVIDKPALTAITPISLDHQEFLGRTLGEIAEVKAGIIKTGVPCIMARQEAAAEKIIEQASKINRAPLYRFGHEWSVIEDVHGFSYVSKTVSLHLPLPNLAGPHQIYNAANAVACIDKLRQFTIDEDDIIYGLTHATWPARLQRLTAGELQKYLPKKAELWLDGGHNEDAAKALSGWAAEDKDKPLYVICGMLKNKNTSAFLGHLAPYIRHLAGVGIPGVSGARPAEEIARLGASHNIASFSAPSVNEAVRQIVKHAASGGKTYRILACGSLYLAGHILRNNN